MISIITPEIKDTVLKYLCTNATPEQIVSGKTADDLKELGLSYDTFLAVMTLFERIGLLAELELSKKEVSFILRTEAHDLYLKGGFTAKEELFENNLNRLLFVMDELKKQLGPDHQNTVNKLSAIAAQLLNGIALYKK
jgi:hypothetical protein